jgi:glycosyltransferase involved in cell wall biosynthesis
VPPPQLKISVIIPTHNPNALRLQRTLGGLSNQTLSPEEFEVVLVDNASSPPIPTPTIVGLRHVHLVRELSLGLTAARLRGIAEARADVLVFVDDDNVLAPEYLANVVRHFAAEPDLGALGGKVLPEFEKPPAAWVTQFHGLLAVRDHGDRSLRGDWRSPGERTYPTFSPIGAGMAVRRPVALHYAATVGSDPLRRALDRTGQQLVSGGDNDLVMHVLEAGASVGYEPDLSLTHLIPERRLERSYLGALNRAIARSWIRVLALHGIRPWKSIGPATVRFRQCRAWWRVRAWQSDAAWITWQGLCGTFEGQAELASEKEAVTEPRSS